MGWETRRGKRYYYRKERVNGRVRSIYFGSGGRAFLASQEDAEKRRSATRAQEEKASRSCATAGKGAALDLYKVPVNDIPSERLYSYYILIRAEESRQRASVGRVDERTRARLSEIERRGRELTRDIPSTYLSDPADALQSKLNTLCLRVLLARLK